MRRNKRIRLKETNPYKYPLRQKSTECPFAEAKFPLWAAERYLNPRGKASYEIPSAAYGAFNRMDRSNLDHRNDGCGLFASHQPLHLQ
jgi:hypothetical protein